MAAHGWRGDASLEEWLFAQGHSFDFFQAVALLERLDQLVGEPGRAPERFPVRFQASVGFAFAPSDVVAVRRGEKATDPARVVVAFMSLVGGLGPMPEPLAELTMRSTVLRDFAPADFLDIFHHRLIKLLYEVRERHRVSLRGCAPEEARASAHLFALLGLESPNLRRWMGDEGRPLLHYAGLLANEVRSMAGLTAILRHRFGIQVESVPLTGGYRPIEERDQTRIGPSGGNRRLGDSAVIGKRVWDQQGAFELRLGPLSYPELLRFLPGSDGVPTGDALAPFCEIVRFYAGPAIDFTLRLAVEAQDAPPARIGRGASGARDAHGKPRDSGPRLGYSAWIGRRRGDTSSLEVCLPPDELRSAGA